MEAVIIGGFLAIYVAKIVSIGFRLEDMPVKRGLRIRLDAKAGIYLPYVYPLKDGKPVLSEDLIKYLTSEEIIREENILREILRRDAKSMFYNAKKYY